jgi:hypothetical protein
MSEHTVPGPNASVIPKSSAVDLGLTRRAAARRKADWSMERTLAAVDRFVRAVVDHIADGEGDLVGLHAMVELQRHMSAAVDTIARHLLSHDRANYRDIGIALGITKQAAAQRYPRASARRRGAQPGPLR